MIALLLITFFALMILGIPIAFAMGLSAIVTLMVEDRIPLLIVIQRLFAGADSFSYLAIPFFILAGELMLVTRLTRQLVDATTVWLGHIRGGTGTVDIISSMLFGGVSGSGTADMAAVGSILIPRLKQRGYPAPLAAAIEATSGSIGAIIPPSMIMLIYAGIAQVSVGRMFLGGVIPGILTGVGLILVLQIWNRARNWEPASGKAASPVEMGRAFFSATPALGMPLIILGGIAFGIFTATEAGVIAVAYALVVGFLYRDLGLSKLMAAFRNCITITTRVFFPIACATLFGWVLARHQFGVHVTDALLTVSQGSPIAAGLLVIAALLVIGFPIEGLMLLIVFTPILAPVGPMLGYDPVHWGLLIVLAINLAALTPPVGSGIFVCSAIAKCRVEETSFYILPFAGVMFLVVLLCLFFPGLVLWLPNLLMGT